MECEILENGDLKIILNAGEREEFRLEAANVEFDSDDSMYELLEPLVSGSELEWASPEDAGFLTDAPILRDGERFWAWMDYQIVSLQRELAERGEAILKRGY